jgi:hypothetical protein
MKKINGKEYYTFTGLINRMDACKRHEHNLTEKDIPSKVTFKGVAYFLTDNCSSYRNDYHTLTFDVSQVYSGDISKYLTAYEFVVDPSDTEVSVTPSEMWLIRHVEQFSRHKISHVSVEGIVRNNRTLYFWEIVKGKDDCYESCCAIDILPGTFGGFLRGCKYRIENIHEM